MEGVSLLPTKYLKSGKHTLKGGEKHETANQRNTQEPT
jgi:hypothetical protein